MSIRGKWQPDRRRRRSGVTVVIIALSMVSLLGFCALAIDYGLLCADANFLQRTCDAAALAGAQELKKTGDDSGDVGRATTAATTVATKNGMSSGITISYNSTWNKITVQGTKTRSFFFAPILGKKTSDVTRQASAGRIPVTGIDHAVPLAMTVDDYNNYKDGHQFTLDLINNHDTDFNTGTVASLDLRPANAGKSGAVFQDDLDLGYTGTIFLNQDIDNALNANLTSQNNKMDIAMGDRIDDAAAAGYADSGNNYTYPNYPSGDRRIFTMIVADPNAVSNNSPTLTARWFVPVYLVSERTTGGTAKITLRILPTLTVSNADPNIVVGSDSTIFTGPSVVQMLS
jgi:hypothetical protein